MQPQTLIFVGRSGAGKGTQLDLLKKYISEKYPNNKIQSLDMGGIYREFFSHDGEVQKIAKDLSMNQGKFQPDFLTNSLFVARAVMIMDLESHLFIDGFPRSVNQLDTLKQLLNYVGRVNPIVVNIEVPREEVKKRMLARGRGDDAPEKIESRLGEYDRTVVPLLDVIKSDFSLKYIEINGESTPDEIHKDLVNKLSL